MYKKVIFSLLLLSPTSSAVAQSTDTINKAVNECIEVVHSSPGNDFEKFSDKKFDAYYNPATGLVENNVIYMDDKGSLFKFNKCMTSMGLPLGPKK
jgi:hypothetical protein